MKDDNPDPVPVELELKWEKDQPRIFQLSTYREREYDLLDEYVQGKYANKAISQLNGALKPEDRKLAIDSIVRYASELNWATPLGTRTLTTTRGTLKMLQLSLSIKYPEVTEQVLDKYIDTNDIILMEEILEKIAITNGWQLTPKN